MKIPPLHLLESFLIYGSSKSMSKAAQALEISQPALTLRLRLLQSYFTEPLYASEGRRKVLTSFGKSLHSALELKLADFPQLIQSITNDFASENNQLIRIAGRIEILNRMALSISTSIPIEFISADTESALESLIERKCEIAVSRQENVPPYLHRKSLFRNHFGILVPKTWNLKLDRCSGALLKKLLAFPFLSYSETDPSPFTLYSHYDVPYAGRFIKRINDWRTIIQLVEEGSGWGLVPTLYQFNPEKAVCLTVPASILKMTEYFLYYRKEHSSKDWLHQIRDAVKDLH